MTKRRTGRKPARSEGGRQQETGNAFEWIPLWGWALIFLVPLILSEFMFWNAGRVPSMIMFPIAWIGFWYTLMARSGWPILENRGEEDGSGSEEEG